MNRILVCLLAAIVCLLPLAAEAQVASYLVSRFLSETTCILSGSGCFTGKCDVGKSADVFVRTTQNWDIWGELYCPGNSSKTTWERQQPSLMAQGQCNYFLPCTPVFLSPQIWDAGAFHYWKLTANQKFWVGLTDGSGNRLAGSCSPRPAVSIQRQVTKRTNNEPSCKYPSCSLDDYICMELYGQYWGEDPDPAVCQCIKMYTPIIVAVDNQYSLTSESGGVSFDLDADGTVEHVAWTQPEGDDAFLAMDRNGNGVIDNGAELFGIATILSVGILAANGFQALEELDEAGRPDGVIDAADPAYRQLVLWTDRNHNGISEPSEIQSLDASGIVGIETDHRVVGRVDQYGNRFRYRSRVWVDTRTGQVPRQVYDVYLQISSMPVGG
jgi:hypothetical protein